MLGFRRFNPAVLAGMALAAASVASGGEGRGELARRMSSTSRATR